MDSFDEIAAGARLPNWLPLLAERFARERLRALVRLEAWHGGDDAGRPLPLRPQRRPLADGRGRLRHLAGDPRSRVLRRIRARRGSSTAAAVQAMAEVGIDISDELPQPWADEIVRAADVVVTMGCGDACPLYPGKRYVDWELEDPSGKPVGGDQADPGRDRPAGARPHGGDRRRAVTRAPHASAGPDEARAARKPAVGPSGRTIAVDEHDG